MPRERGSDVKVKVLSWLYVRVGEKTEKLCGTWCECEDGEDARPRRKRKRGGPTTGTLSLAKNTLRMQVLSGERRGGGKNGGVSSRSLSG